MHSIKFMTSSEKNDHLGLCIKFCYVYVACCNGSMMYNNMCVCTVGVSALCYTLGVLIHVLVYMYSLLFCRKHNIIGLVSESRDQS